MIGFSVDPPWLVDELGIAWCRASVDLDLTVPGRAWVRLYIRSAGAVALRFAPDLTATDPPKTPFGSSVSSAHCEERILSTGERILGIIFFAENGLSSGSSISFRVRRADQSSISVNTSDMRVNVATIESSKPPVGPSRDDLEVFDVTVVPIPS